MVNDVMVKDGGYHGLFVMRSGWRYDNGWGWLELSRCGDEGGRDKYEGSID